MTTALVYGSYPPAVDPEAVAALATVRALRADGVDVTVVSPIASGAHHHADLRTLAGTLRFAKLLAATDRAVLYLEPGVLCGSLAARTVPLGRLAVAAVLRRVRHVEVYCRPIGGTLHPPSVRSVFGSVDRVVAATADDRDALVAAGLSVERVEVAPAPSRRRAPDRPASDERGGTTQPSWRLPSDAGRDEIQAEIRRRASASAGRSSGAGPGDHLPGTLVTRPLMAIRPLGPAPARSSRPGVGVVKRLIRRATGWQLDPVIEHVNRLQRATLEAFENQKETERG